MMIWKKRWVAPLVGAWIETYHKDYYFYNFRSLPSWGRGLKQIPRLFRRQKGTSLPSWGRGLKHLWRPLLRGILLSLPSWGRGLKLYLDLCDTIDITVAPLVGAWIETKGNRPKALYTKSLPSWGRGLKQLLHAVALVALASLPSWGRGLKHRLRLEVKVNGTSLPSWGRGLKLPRVTRRSSCRSRSPRGGVD